MAVTGKCRYVLDPLHIHNFEWLTLSCDALHVVENKTKNRYFVKSVICDAGYLGAILVAEGLCTREESLGVPCSSVSSSILLLVVLVRL